MLKLEVPSQVHELLDRERLNGVPVLLSAKTDLSLPGELTSQWVIANREHLAVVSGDDQPRVEAHLPIRSVERFRAHSTVGSGFLQAYVDKTWVDVARYSNGLAAQFQKFADKLEDLRSTGRVELQPAEQLPTAHCPKCHLRLPGPAEPCPRCLPRKALALRLAQLMRPQWKLAAGMVALMLIGVALELVPPKLQQYLVDQILSKGDSAPLASSHFTALAVVVVSLAAARVLLLAVNWVKGLLANLVGVRLSFELRTQLVKKLHALGVAYHDRHEVGSLTSRVQHDAEVVHGVLQEITGGFLLQIVQLIAVGVMLFTLNAKLAFVTMIPAPLVIALSFYFWRRVYPNYYRYWDGRAKQAGALNGVLSGMRVVKAFAQEDRELARYTATNDYIRRSRITVERANHTFAALMALVFSLGGLIVWYVGGRDVLAGHMTLGSLMAFLAYLAMFYAPLSTLAEFTTWLTSFLTGCQRVFELLDTPSETREPAEPKQLTNPRGQVRFDNVTFGYDRRRPVLKNLNFTIEPGQQIGIVGRSGSGKSTLVNLICRFYDANAGRVLVDGVDVRDLASSDLRQSIGVVLQEPFLFRGTICDNLVYGKPDAGPEEALTAARAALAHEFILRTPLAYDTWLGERGAGLSGGEKQRISIARALVYDPRILILDEATSSVDTESEQEIQEALRVLTHGRTTVAIAHRLSTLRDSDCIFVLDQGRLAEQGTHDELMHVGGQYARLVKIQTQIARNHNFQATVDAVAGFPTAAVANLPTEPIVAGLPTEPLSEIAPGDVSHTPAFAPTWLDPATAMLRAGPHHTLEIHLKGGPRHRGVFALRCFPATRPDEFISLRTTSLDGPDVELGIVRSLADWPAASQELLRRTLARGYHHRRITGINTARLKDDYLELAVRTDHGPTRFTMRWEESQAQDFGPRGKVLIDTEENHYLVSDVGQLPDKERQLFERFIYW